MVTAARIVRCGIGLHWLSAEPMAPPSQALLDSGPCAKTCRVTVE